VEAFRLGFKLMYDAALSLLSDAGSMEEICEVLNECQTDWHIGALNEPEWNRRMLAETPSLLTVSTDGECSHRFLHRALGPGKMALGRGKVALGRGKKALGGAHVRGGGHQVARASTRARAPEGAWCTRPGCCSAGRWRCCWAGSTARPSAVRPKRLDIESPWLHLASECQRC
jgi:hypothetical protein